MSLPPLTDRTPPTPDGSDALATVASLGEELAGVSDPATIAHLLAGAITRLFDPDSLVIVLFDSAGGRWLAFAHNYVKARTDHPLVDVALAAPRLLQGDEIRRYSPDPSAASWLGAPLRGAGGRCIGAAALWSMKAGSFNERHLRELKALLACGAIALDDARLLDLLSIGKREWERTVDAISEAYCVVDRNGVIRRANRSFGEIVRRPLTTLAGQSWSSLLPDGWVEPVAKVLARRGSGSVDLPAGERLYTVSAFPIGAPDAGAAVLVFADQTEKRRLQEQLVQSEKMSAIGQLIAGVAHDLNNPLASVVGFADYLVESEKNAPPQLLEPLRAIQQEAERAANIVRNLLTFARKQERRRRRQPVGPSLEATILLLRNQLMACKVESHLTIDADLPEVTFDANQIQQVFVNMINNAAQAIQPTGRLGNVWVRASRWLDGVVVTIVDDGPGIPESIAARVFEPFFTTKSEGQGTGLGLSICHGIIAEHGGRITLARRPEGGASFRVELPGGAPAQAGPVVPAPTDTGKLRMLVVDDEPHILHYMRATLETWGHTVELASDGADALARARTDVFDVIITDIRMAEVGGREFYETLRAERPEAAARVVFSTGDTVRGDTLSFLESLGRPYLHKPFSLAELRAALASAVGREEGRGKREE